MLNQSELQNQDNQDDISHDNLAITESVPGLSDQSNILYAILAGVNSSDPRRGALGLGCGAFRLSDRPDGYRRGLAGQLRRQEIWPRI